MGERDKPVVSAAGRLLGYIRPHPAMTERCEDCGDTGYESVERGTLCPTCNGRNADFSDYPQERRDG